MSKGTSGSSTRPAFYGKDAFEGLHTIDRLMELDRSGGEDPDFGRAPGGRARVTARPAHRGLQTSTCRDPGVPFGGPRQPRSRAALYRHEGRKGLPLDEIAGYINETSLFRNQWGYRPLEGETDALSRRGYGPSCASNCPTPARPMSCAPPWPTGTSPPTPTGTTSSSGRAPGAPRAGPPPLPPPGGKPLAMYRRFLPPLASGESDYVAFPS